MNKYFKKSRVKVTALIFFIIIVEIFGTLFFIFFINMKQGASIYIFIVLGVLAIYSVIKVKSQYDEYLIVNPAEIKLVDSPIVWQTKFTEIKKIKYTGLQWIPMSEVLVIESEVDTIYVDFNFIRYLEVWKDILDICLEQKPDIDVDPRLIKRLKYSRK